MRTLALLILSAALTGCRPAPGPAPEAATPTAPVPARDTRPLIVCFGDSLTAGFGTDPGASYPDYLQKSISAYHILNAGVSGNTTKDGVERLPSILALKPEIVVVEFGGNDGLRGLKPQITHDNLARIVEGLKTSGTKVLLAGITLPPDYGPDYIHQFNANYTAIAKQFNVQLLPFLLQNVYGVPGMMQSDRTHATAAGNEIVARNVEQALTPLIRQSAALASQPPAAPRRATPSAQ